MRRSGEVILRKEDCLESESRTMREIVVNSSLLAECGCLPQKSRIKGDWERRLVVSHKGSAVDGKKTSARPLTDNSMKGDSWSSTH